MMNEYNFNTKFLKIWVHRKPCRYMKVKDNLVFDDFFAEVGVAQMGIFSNQAELDTIYQICSTSSFFPTTLHLSPNTI